MAPEIFALGTGTQLNTVPGVEEVNASWVVSPEQRVGVATGSATGVGFTTKVVVAVSARQLPGGSLVINVRVMEPTYPPGGV